MKVIAKYYLLSTLLLTSVKKSSFTVHLSPKEKWKVTVGRGPLGSFKGSALRSSPYAFLTGANKRELLHSLCEYRGCITTHLMILLQTRGYTRVAEQGRQLSLRFQQSLPLTYL